MSMADYADWKENLQGDLKDIGLLISKWMEDKAYQYHIFLGMKIEHRTTWSWNMTSFWINE